jgi:hypothetical protein
MKDLYQNLIGRLELQNPGLPLILGLSGPGSRLRGNRIMSRHPAFSGSFEPSDKLLM